MRPAFGLCALMAIGSIAQAQDIEPRAYSNAPVGVNFLIVGYGYRQGGLSPDPNLPITNVSLITKGPFLAYVRALDLWGKSGKIDVIVPYTWLSGSAILRGVPLERVVNGFSNSLLRASINLYGAPALTLKEFATYQQGSIIGASLQVSVPSGQYDNSRVVNIGTNRWFVKPEVGVSKVMGAWTFELMAATIFYSANKDFFGGMTRAQDPVYASQGHAIYSFSQRIWASVDATYFEGGRSTLDGIPNDDRQRNWRAGGTFAMSLDTHNSVKFYASSGVSARTGNNFDLIGVAWQYRWGGGL